MALQKTNRHFGFLVALIAFQAMCTLFFTIDALSDLGNVGLSSFTDLHRLPEMGATLGLIFAMGFDCVRARCRQLYHQRLFDCRGVELAQLRRGDGQDPSQCNLSQVGDQWPGPTGQSADRRPVARAIGRQHEHTLMMAPLAELRQRPDAGLANDAKTAID